MLVDPDGGNGQKENKNYYAAAQIKGSKRWYYINGKCSRRKNM